MKVRRVTHYEWDGKEYRSCRDAAVARGESTLTAIVGHGFGNAIIRCWNDGAREPVSGSNWFRQSGTLTANKEER